MQFFPIGSYSLHQSTSRYYGDNAGVAYVSPTPDSQAPAFLPDPKGHWDGQAFRTLGSSNLLLSMHSQRKVDQGGARELQNVKASGVERLPLDLKA
jgi:hypothetical protein